MHATWNRQITAYANFYNNFAFNITCRTKRGVSPMSEHWALICNIQRAATTSYRAPIVAVTRYVAALATGPTKSIGCNNALTTVYLGCVSFATKRNGLTCAICIFRENLGKHLSLLPKLSHQVEFHEAVTPAYIYFLSTHLNMCRASPCARREVVNDQRDPHATTGSSFSCFSAHILDNFLSHGLIGDAIKH